MSFKYIYIEREGVRENMVMFVYCFLKLFFFCFKKQGREENMFGFYCDFVLKNTKHTKLKEQ